MGGYVSTPSFNDLKFRETFDHATGWRWDFDELDHHWPTLDARDFKPISFTEKPEPAISPWARFGPRTRLVPFLGQTYDYTYADEYTAEWVRPPMLNINIPQPEASSVHAYREVV